MPGIQYLIIVIAYLNYTTICYRYDVEHFEEKILEMYKDLEPLYQQLHAYVRRKLYQKYGGVSYATFSKHIYSLIQF